MTNKKDIYGSADYGVTPSNETMQSIQNNVPVNTIDYEQELQNYIDKNKKFTQDIIEQRNIISNSMQEVNSLKEQLALSNKQVEEYKVKLQELSTLKQNTAPDEYAAKFESLESRLKYFEEADFKARFEPVKQVLSEFGVTRDNFTQVIEQVKRDYSVDLVANPNEFIARSVLSNMFGQQEPSTIPQGTYVNTQNQVVDNAFAEVQERVKQRKLELEQKRQELQQKNKLR